MCCVFGVRVMGFPIEAQPLLERYQTHVATATSLTDDGWMEMCFSTRQYGIGHDVPPERFMRALKEVVGFARYLTDVLHVSQDHVTVVQYEDPCETHHVSYPFEISEFCTEAMRPREEAQV